MLVFVTGASTARPAMPWQVTEGTSTTSTVQRRPWSGSVDPGLVGQDSGIAAIVSVSIVRYFSILTDIQTEAATCNVRPGLTYAGASEIGIVIPRNPCGEEGLDLLRLSYQYTLLVPDFQTSKYLARNRRLCCFQVEIQRLDETQLLTGFRISALTGLDTHPRSTWTPRSRLYSSFATCRI